MQAEHLNENAKPALGMLHASIGEKGKLKIVSFTWDSYMHNCNKNRLKRKKDTEDTMEYKKIRALKKVDSKNIKNHRQ